MAGILDADDIAELRADVVEALAMPSTFALVQDTEVADGAGGTTTTPVTVAVGDCCLRIIGSGAAASGERIIAERLGWTSAYAVDLPYSVVVTPSNRLVVDGRTFEIGAVIDTGVWAMKKIAICQEGG